VEFLPKKADLIVLIIRVQGRISGKEAMMPAQTSETRASVVAFAPKKGRPDSTMMTDDAGQHVIALVQKASDMAKADCQRAMDLANRVSSELRAAEERARAFEEEANYFRDRAARAEQWLARIESEVQQAFFQNNNSSHF
jgi:hypothetical protein